MLGLQQIGSWAGRLLASEPTDEERIAFFQSLVDTQYRRIYALAYRIVRSESDAADLTQETFLRVWHALPRLRADAAQIAWLRRIATNLCLDHLRRRKCRVAILQPVSLDTGTDDAGTMDATDTSGDPLRLLQTSERVQVLLDAINALPEDYRDVITLHHLEDRRVDEIAEELQIPAGTVKSRLSRARRALHRRLAPYFLG
jgi:RNA polymerase sigma-70 factor (ECF subfamily)